MGKLEIIKAGPLATIQDFGRFGYRRFGIPQSGAMDKEWMIAANQLVGNPVSYPLIEFAIAGPKLKALKKTFIAVVGADCNVNGMSTPSGPISLKAGDVVEVAAPHAVYGYLAIQGLIKANKDFGSFSTYMMAGFGGIEGRVLKAGDVLETSLSEVEERKPKIPIRNQNPVEIRVMKGPEWNLLKEIPYSKTFKIAASSNRMGIRLEGDLECDFREIASSAVVPGTIQLPANKQPIVLMNDCQTTGGYPRIGKVLDDDLGKLAQVRTGQKITLVQP